jgi:cephalosporin hydroxylase
VSIIRRTAVAVGQRYQEASRGYLGKVSPSWVVEEVFTTPVDMLAYARLACTTDPSLRKTLSIAVLTDRRRFSAATDEPGEHVHH